MTIKGFCTGVGILLLLAWSRCAAGGKLLDGFLETRNDNLLLDYLVNAFYFDKSMDEYGILKRYSLCQLFLEKDRESELDWKLVPFLGMGGGC